MIRSQLGIPWSFLCTTGPSQGPQQLSENVLIGIIPRVCENTDTSAVIVLFHRCSNTGAAGLAVLTLADQRAGVISADYEVCNLLNLGVADHVKAVGDPPHLCDSWLSPQQFLKNLIADIIKL